MNLPAPEDVQRRFREVAELRELMIAMRRQVLVRENPGESDEQIDARLRSWLMRPDPPSRRFRQTFPARSQG